MPEQPTPIGRGLTCKLARQIREASLMATPQESVELDRLCLLIKQEAIAVPDASQLVRTVIHSQHLRRAA